MYLVCLKCGGNLFVGTYKLRKGQSGGTLPEVVGHACLTCHTLADPLLMASALDLAKKKAEFERMKAEMETLCPAADQKAPAKSST